MENLNQQISISDFAFDEQVFQQQQNVDAMQPSSEQQGYSAATGYEVSAAKGFRARWRARSQAKRDDMSYVWRRWVGLSTADHLQLAVHLA